MPTVVADLDIESLPSSLLGLGTYRGALILLRLRGVPFGQVWLPAVDGQVDLSGLKDQAAELIDPAVWQRIVRAELETPASGGCAALADVTVAVCTRDRPLALEGCLTALGRLEQAQDISAMNSFNSTIVRTISSIAAFALYLAAMADN